MCNLTLLCKVVLGQVLAADGLGNKELQSYAYSEPWYIFSPHISL